MATHNSRVGQLVGNYHLTRLLGQGGFADVYLGEHVHLNTYVAVKILHTRLAEEDITNFRNEAQMIARLQHPHIVRVYDFGVTNDFPYLIMDHAPNGTLRSQHSRGARVPSAGVVHYVKQIASALQYAHDQRLIHRDIKPENMLLGRNNEVLLSDFGIALISQTSQYQSPQNIAGTIAYMAPEQIQAHPRPASDQYALAIVAYEWLCGTRPFQGSYTEIAVKHAMVPPPPLRSLAPNLSPALEQVIMIALNKEPQQRFASVQAFAQALEQADENNVQTARGAYAGHNPTPHMPPFAGSNQAPLPPFVQQAPSISPQPYSIPSVASALSTPHIAQHIQSGIHTPQPMPPHAQYTPQTMPPQNQSVPTPKKISRRTLLTAGIGTAAVVGAGFAFYTLLPKTTGFSTLVGNITSGNGINTSDLLPTDKSLVTYKGQEDFIWDVSWSPNGRYIASCSKDGTAHIWEAQSGKRILTYRSGIEPARSDNDAKIAAWSHDSKRLAVGFIDGTVQIIDVEKGQRSNLFQVGVAVISAISWSPDDAYIAAGGSGQVVKILKTHSGEVVYTYDGHTNFVSTVAWSHDGQTVASGAWDYKIHLWEPFTGKQKLIYSEHEETISSISWSKDDTQIVSTAQSNNVANLWNAKTGHTTISYNKHQGNFVFIALWSPDNKHILSGGNDMNMHIWKPENGDIVQKINTTIIYNADWSPDGTRFVTAGYDKTSRVWPVKI